MRKEEFDSLYCQALNEQQQEAVHSVEGAVLLLAVPGSGKTTVLVNRLGYMVKCCGIDPRSILTMTYTVAATAEMKQRFGNLFGYAYQRDMTISTINSISAQIVKHYAAKYGSGSAFPVVSNEDAAGIVSRIYRELYDEYPTDSTIKDIRRGIGYVKNMMLSGDEVKNVDVGVERFEEIYRRYNQELKARGLMDFDDQMVYAKKALEKYPDVLEYYQERYRYICVDESQDTSKIQHEIIKLLASKYGNIFMVGDEDQSIYGFRAAYPDALLRFEQDYPGAKVLLMEKNYRSVPAIVEAANGFIARNQFRHPKTLRAVRAGDTQIHTVRSANRMAQYGYLFEVGKRCQEETAILYRNNDSALPLIDLFDRHGIPFNCRQFEDAFFSHKVVADIRDLITFAYEPCNGEVFMRIYYKLSAPISKAAAQEACQRSKTSGKPILDALLDGTGLNSYGREAVLDMKTVLSALPQDTAEGALQQVWSGLRYHKFVAERKLDGGKLDILRLLARQVSSPMELLLRLEELRQVVSAHQNREDCPLILSTVHSSKGLEYHRVYLLDVLDGILPAKVYREVSGDEDLRHYEEDRRIFYVAMTRAKNELYLFTSPTMDAEFIDEVISRLPVAVINENDVFAALQGNLLGKVYTDRQKGTGTVSAQCDDLILVTYGGGASELLTLDEMMQNRNRKKQYEAPRAQEPPKAPLQKPSKPQTLTRFYPGMQVRHGMFGDGVVLGIKDNKIEIRFAGKYGVKQLMLETVVQNKLLQQL